MLIYFHLASVTFASWLPQLKENNYWNNAIRPNINPSGNLQNSKSQK